MMNQYNLNESLIQTMRNCLPEGINLANILMETLNLGKEATYRRLRGEVPFTLAEAALITQKMRLSLDKLVGAQAHKNALINLNMVEYEFPADTHYNLVSSYIKVFASVTEDPTAELCTSSNILPQTLYLKYDALARFRMFKWMYQHEKTHFSKRFEDLVLPEKLLDKLKEFVAYAQLFHHTSHVWDREMIPHLVNDINYFASLNLISEETVRLLKEEVLYLLDDLEHIAAQGAYKNGNEVLIYLSNINFEATYSYVETSSFHLSMIRVFAINSLTSDDDNLFVRLKAWIQSLKKFSTLISRSGDIERVQFFSKQREIVRGLGR